MKEKRKAKKALSRGRGSGACSARVQKDVSHALRAMGVSRKRARQRVRTEKLSVEDVSEGVLDLGGGKFLGFKDYMPEAAPGTTCVLHCHGERSLATRARAA